MVRNKKDIIYYSIKCKLKNILKFNDLNGIIKNRVEIVNKIWKETYFFFNLYIFNSLKINTCPNFNKVTIQRCALFVLGLSNTIKKKDNEYDSLHKIYIEKYIPIGDNKLFKYSNLKSIKKPFEFLSVQMITNIYNHIQCNFYKFQKKYLKAKIFEQFLKLKTKRKIMYSILNTVQYHINNDIEKN